MRGGSSTKVDVEIDLEYLFEVIREGLYAWEIAGSCGHARTNCCGFFARASSTLKPTVEADRTGVATVEIFRLDGFGTHVGVTPR